MTIRNLDAIFSPASVALIGASRTPKSIGAVLTDNLLKTGFPGQIYLVNPRYESIREHRSYPDIKSLPVTPDLAIIATPPRQIPEIIAELAANGTRGAVVITAGYGEKEKENGKRWKQAILEASRPNLLRVIGPNCLGIMVPGQCLNASFGHLNPLTGNLAFVAQSGALLTSVLDWATSREIGFSHFVSLGDMVDVDFGDMLDYLAADGPTQAILLYIESITNARKFMSAARAAARLKPVIVVKGGRFTESAQAAASHTGALAGIDGVFDAAFRRAGILRVMDMEALFNAVETLSMARPLSGDRLAILTNGGGVGVLATDTLIEKQGRLATLDPETIARLDEVLPPTWSRTNPIDIIGDADGERYHKAMSVLLEDKGVDAILVMNCPTAISSSTDSARAVIQAVEQRKSIFRRPMLLAGWLGDGAALEARHLFRKSRIPCYQSPSDAVRGFMQMVRYQHSQEMLMETVPNIPGRFTPDTEKVRRIIAQALSKQRDWLSDDEARLVLAAYDIPVVQALFTATPEEAGTAAAVFSGPLALKIISPDIHHKSDVGGVILDLENGEAVREAAAHMQQRLTREFPAAQLTGFSVQQMIRRPHGRELIIGAFTDDQFGPVLLFGHGGTAVEVIRDKALALPPLNIHLAREVMARTRVYRLLQEYRNTPAADIDAVALSLVKLSQLVCDIAEITELDINPLVADEHGVMALDARIRICPAKGEATERLAIRPYPRELEEHLTLADGRRLLLRPIRPEDETGFQEIFAALSPEEIRMRFLHPMNSLPHKLAARLTQIDYAREMALVLEGPINENDDKTILYGGVRIIADPDNEEAEFAILLRKEMTGSGLGPMLMRRIIDYARNRGIGKLFGEVLTDNTPMLRLAAAFGFTCRPVRDDAGLRLLELKL
ncbi:bifunctional acetate--CoA ligase family protein/GNAT family N-acetyltransferase [Desulfopila aestuarii]|uniref:Acetyltransferase n=1 Tax=Desulfopila aestuarii DSM 18488 TaxID=1121416 RepID=A0A1M7Y6L8_9BACT|nr:bifunctional acetate--CoA ligase family protein/GNAT family N-acetyltransferase [Desulfopila aestuarii]SHO48297.1 acetyltransferase [Desulfopila aestuarii DSM 18488]